MLSFFVRLTGSLNPAGSDNQAKRICKLACKCASADCSASVSAEPKRSATRVAAHAAGLARSMPVIRRRIKSSPKNLAKQARKGFAFYDNSRQRFVKDSRDACPYRRKVLAAAEHPCGEAGRIAPKANAFARKEYAHNPHHYTTAFYPCFRLVFILTFVFYYICIILLRLLIVFLAPEYTYKSGFIC